MEAYIFGYASKATREGGELQLDYRPDPQTLLHFVDSSIHVITNKPSDVFLNSVSDDSFNSLITQLFDNHWRQGTGYYYRSVMAFLRLTKHTGPVKRLGILAKKSFRPTDSGK